MEINKFSIYKSAYFLEDLKGKQNPDQMGSVWQLRVYFKKNLCSGNIYYFII